MKLTRKEMSLRSEKAAALRFGGRRQIASGALAHSKGDIRTAEYLIEDKITAARSYSITRKVWDKIAVEALNVGKTPLLRVTIDGKTLVVCNEHDFLSLK